MKIKPMRILTMINQSFGSSEQSPTVKTLKNRMSRDYMRDTTTLVEDNLEELQESKISKTLSERTTKTLILIILLMLFLLPFFQIETYVSASSNSFDKGLATLITIYEQFGGAS